VQPLLLKTLNEIAMNKENHVSATGYLLVILVFLNAVILKTAFIKNENWYIALLITLPLVLVIVAKLNTEKNFIQLIKRHENSKK
jgi:hypothetical protein